MTLNDFKNHCKQFNKKGRRSVLQVDLQYPDELHDSHDDFPLCPEVSKVNDMKYFNSICNTFHKKKYRIHHKMLLVVLEHGVKLNKIYKSVSFNDKK